MRAILIVDVALIVMSGVEISVCLAFRWRPSDRLASSFWLALRIAEGLALTQVVAVAVLYELGHHANERLFYLYAILPIGVNLFAEDIRAQALRSAAEANPAPMQLPADRPTGRPSPAVIQRQLDIMALAALATLFLAARALGTSAGL